MCTAGLKFFCAAAFVLASVQAHQAKDSGARTVEVSHAARQHEMSQAALMRRTSQGALVHEGAAVADAEKPPVPHLQPKAEEPHATPAHHKSALEHPVVQKLAEWFAIASPDPIRSASLAEDRVQMEKSLHQKASSNSSTASLVSVQEPDGNKGNLSDMETTKDTGGCGDEWNDGKKVEWCNCISNGAIDEEKEKMSDFMKCAADGTPTNLDDTKAQRIHTIIQTNVQAECDLLKLATFCLVETECLGEHHMASCKKDKEKVPGCDVECGHASRNGVLSAILASVLAATALFSL